jgi:YD repeat-containing protein
MSGNGTTWDFEYNADGLRTKRVSSSTTYQYVYNGSSLVQMTVGNNTLYFTSDTVTYNGTTYYYAKNLQGDIVAILNASGTAVVQYTYDAWGKLLSTTGSMANTLGVHNPLRYRGYVYDTESTLYYFRCRWRMALTSDNQLFSCIFRHDGVQYRHQLIRR